MKEQKETPSDSTELNTFSACQETGEIAPAPINGCKEGREWSIFVDLCDLEK
jgi:hypothetical protein